jgi:thymidylate synthase (FAD)
MGYDIVCSIWKHIAGFVPDNALRTLLNIRFKHKQGFVENEESRRYISGTPELFIPEHFRNAPPEGHNKQGSVGVHHSSEYISKGYELIAKKALDYYEEMIKMGVAPEQARFILPQGFMVNWIWTGSLMSYARFYNQRTDPHAQLEIQQLASQVGEIIEPLFPVSWRALTK